MRRPQTVFIGVAIALLAAGAGYWAAGHSHRAATAPGLFAGPDFVLTDLAGQPRHLSSWRGRPIVLNFWATWCLPCREEVPLLVDIQRRYAARGLQVIGIAIDRRDEVAAFGALHGINYPVLIADDDTFDLLIQYGNRAGGLPYTVILAPDGNVAFRKLGAFNKVDLENAVARVIKPAPR